VKSLPILASGSLLFGVSVVSAVTVFTDETAFIEALDRIETETFNQIDPEVVSLSNPVDLQFFSVESVRGQSVSDDPFAEQPLFRNVSFNPLDVEFIGQVTAGSFGSGTVQFDLNTPVTVTPLGATGAALSNAPLTIFDALVEPSDEGSATGIQTAFASPATFSSGGVALGALGGGALGAAGVSAVAATGTAAAAASEFFGVISETPIESLVFASEDTTTDPNVPVSQVFGVDDVVISPAIAAVPLPSSMVTMLAGLAVFGAWRRRKTA